MMLFNIMEELNKVMERLKDFIMDNKSNAFMWLSFFFLGLIISWLVFSALSKDE